MVDVYTKKKRDELAFMWPLFFKDVVMKTILIGSGAMGCLFGGFLTRAGEDVQLLDVWPEHVEVIQEGGLSLVADGEVEKIAVDITLDAGRIRPAELIIIFVKHAHTGDAAKTAHRLLDDGGVVLTLQNGMGNAEILAERLGHERVVCGTTAQGAMLLGPGRVQHSGVGETVIGMWDGSDQPVVSRIADYFTSAGIETRCVREIEPIVWNKLLVNVGINAITALTGIRNGQLLDRGSTRDLVTAAVQEAATVASAHGVVIRKDFMEHVFQVAKATGTNRSSMGQDVDAHRETEIQAINGYIVQKARERRLPVPVNETLSALIMTLQDHYP